MKFEHNSSQELKFLISENDRNTNKKKLLKIYIWNLEEKKSPKNIVSSHPLFPF
jgi:hypothetical protein